MIKRCSYICVLISLLVVKTQAQEGPLIALYKGFLAATNSDGFLVVKRKITFPASPRRILEHLATNGVQRTERRVDYFVSFCWDGPRFVIAFSSDAPLTNESDFATAERLYGYDGTNYWRLLNDASKTYVGSPADLSVAAPIDVSSYLSIIPEEEVLSSQNKYVANPAYTSIMQFASECRHVAQFGYEGNLTEPPRITSDNTIVISGTSKHAKAAEFTGDADQPTSITFGASAKGAPTFRLSMDYATDTMTVDRVSSVSGKTMNTIRYTILLFRAPVLSTPKSPFSWQSYQATAGNIIGDTAKAGATVNMEVTKDGVPQLGKVSTPAQPLPGRARNPIYVYLIFALSSIIPIVLIIRFRNQKQRSKNGGVS